MSQQQLTNQRVVNSSFLFRCFWPISAWEVLATAKKLTNGDMRGEDWDEMAFAGILDGSLIFGPNGKLLHNQLTLIKLAIRLSPCGKDGISLAT